MSAWVLPLVALDAARVTAPERSEPILDYLNEPGAGGIDLDLTVELNGHVISRPSFREMYWTAAQQLAHMTVNGASLRTGDLYASGTVSGPDPGQRGSFIELTWNGRDPLALPDGSTRTFLDDGDEVRLTATAPGASGGKVALGDVTGQVHPTP